MSHSEIISQFSLPIHIQEVIPFGSGHINETLRIVNADPAGEDYLLQKINHHVFKDVAGMMNNIQLVTDYLREGNRLPVGQQTLTVIPDKEGKAFIQDAEGNYWRIYIFMKGLVSFDIVSSLDQIYEGAKSFGIFLTSLQAFPVEKLVPTIPDFHNVLFRLRNLKRAVQADAKGRVGEVQQWLGFVESVQSEMTKIEIAGERGEIPLRVTHNDTKFNNVLLSKEGKGVCVIDLDTVMPGYAAYDFGDGVRTTISSAPEDEPDLDRIQIDLGRFEAFAAGYLEATRSMLTENELATLPISGALFAYLMGVRFLTDYLEGDVYYRIHFEKQNLQRASSQLTLCRNILAQLPALQKIVIG